MSRSPILLLAALVFLLLPRSAHAQLEPAKQTSAAFHLDLETDPTAFLLGGYSAHVGLGLDHLRLDLGIFAMDLPAFVHDQPDFDASFDGAGLKAQYFFSPQQHGAFVGVDAGYVRQEVERRDSSGSARHGQLSVGVNGGYRISLPAGFYVTPWLGLSYGLGASELVVNDMAYRSSPWQVFPAVHVGHQFL